MSVGQSKILNWVKQALLQLRNQKAVSLNLVFTNENGRVRVTGTIGRPCGQTFVDKAN